jgi:hypothetical protein
VEAVQEWMTLATLESSKVLVNCLKGLGSVLWLNGWESDGVLVGLLHLSLSHKLASADKSDVCPDDGPRATSNMT